MLRKTNILSISVLLCEISSLRISPKCFNVAGNHSLAVCGSFWGEKQFLLIFLPFNWFDQKQLFKQIQFSSTFAPFKHVKKNKLSEYFSAFF